MELWRRVVLAMDTPLAMFGFALLANADQGAVLRSGPFEVTFRHPGDANLVMELLEDEGERGSGRADAANKGVQTNQAVDVFKCWLDEHPEVRHYAGSSLIAATLKEKFPCN